MSLWLRILAHRVVTAASCVVLCRLIDVLAMRCEEKGISGQILVDGQKRPKYFKCVTGYVVQVSTASRLSLPLRTCACNGKRTIAVSNTPHRYGNTRAIWDHTVLPATRQR